MTANTSLDFCVSPAKALTGNLRVPGDKSISHRALMFAAIAEGESSIEGFLNSEDTLATMRALRCMGVDIRQKSDTFVYVTGVGMKGLQAPAVALDLGNSGTSVRLFAGLLAGQNFASELRGDASLMTRPMRRITGPLQQMGADIACTEAGLLPITIRGNSRLKGISYAMPVASAQLKSTILLAGLYAEGKTCVSEPAITRDHSERMLLEFGAGLEKNNNQVCIKASELQAQDISVPGDISSAAFFMVAAAIVPGSSLLLENVGVNPSRHAIIEILQAMGADIEISNEHLRSGEPVADIRIRHSPLHGIDIPQALVPIAIDEMPVLMIAAACASGETVLSGADELRIKESDRIQAMCEGLGKLGIEVEELADGMRVRGGKLGGGTVQSFTDHRIAMSFAVAALVASAQVRILDCANVRTSFPQFTDYFKSLGIEINNERRTHA